MTKAEAIKALKEGKKITHRSFPPGAYLMQDVHGFYRDAKGYNWGYEGERFWKHKQRGMWWQCDYGLYEPKKENA